MPLIYSLKPVRLSWKFNLVVKRNNITKRVQYHQNTNIMVSRKEMVYISRFTRLKFTSLLIPYIITVVWVLWFCAFVSNALKRRAIPKVYYTDLLYFVFWVYLCLYVRLSTSFCNQNTARSYAWIFTKFFREIIFNVGTIPIDFGGKSFPI